MKKILVVEDDASISQLIFEKLKDESFQIDIESNGLNALKKALKNNYDIILLDIMLPGMTGTEVCKQLRAKKNTSVIIFLTSKSEEVDKILGLEFGADDYITKPFSPRELLSRINARIRRVDNVLSNALTEEKNSTKQLQLGDMVIDTEKRSVEINGTSIELTLKEFELLALLSSKPGRVYTRSQLLNLVWGTDFEGYEHTVNTHINRLRLKIEQDPSKPHYILTQWGVGYKFKD